MSRCPCCDDTLLQEFRHQEFVLFCRSCWQEMSDLESLVTLAQVSRTGANVTSIQSQHPRMKGGLVLLRNPHRAA